MEYANLVPARAHGYSGGSSIGFKVRVLAIDSFSVHCWQVTSLMEKLGSAGSCGYGRTESGSLGFDGAVQSQNCAASEASTIEENEKPTAS